MSSPRSQLPDPLIEIDRPTVVRLARSYRGRWLPLAKALIVIQDARAFAGWGFASLAQYAERELHLSKGNCYELIFAARWLAAHRPADFAQDGPSDGLPGHNEIARLARAMARQAPDGELLERGLFDEKWSRERLRAEIARRRPARAAVARPVRSADDEIKALRALVAALSTELAEVRARLDAALSERDLLRAAHRAGRSVVMPGVHLATLRRRIAQYVHPDKGGDEETMRQVNVLFDLLIGVGVGVDFALRARAS